jgi:hypothetical protein
LTDESGAILATAEGTYVPLDAAVGSDVRRDLNDSILRRVDARLRKQVPATGACDFIEAKLMAVPTVTLRDVRRSLRFVSWAC